MRRYLNFLINSLSLVTNIKYIDEYKIHLAKYKKETKISFRVKLTKLITNENKPIAENKSIGLSSLKLVFLIFLKSKTIQSDAIIKKTISLTLKDTEPIWIFPSSTIGKIIKRRINK